MTHHTTPMLAFWANMGFPVYPIKSLWKKNTNGLILKTGDFWVKQIANLYLNVNIDGLKDLS